MSNLEGIEFLKDVPIEETTGKSQLVFIPLDPKYLKIENNSESFEKRPQTPFGWRLIIDLDIAVSGEEDSTFQLPVRKVKGHVADFIVIEVSEYEILQEEESEEIKHSTLELIKLYVEKYGGEGSDALLTLAKIRSDRATLGKKSKNYTILSFPASLYRDKEEKLYHYLISTFGQIEKRVYFNPIEADLLSLVDMGSIEFKDINMDASKKKEIDRLLSGMYLDDDYPEGESSQTIRKQIEEYTNIANFKKGKSMQHSGVALYGPPGTGKTHLIQESIGIIYKEVLGYHFFKVDMSEILSNQYVGGLSVNISELIFKPAMEWVKRERTPCMVYVDEATDLLADPESEHEWLKQGIDTMKSFINQSQYPGIILILASNIDRADMDDALTRDGRLREIEIPLPSRNRCRSVWNFAFQTHIFSSKRQKFSGTSLTREQQIERLAYISSKKINVASITSFAKIYREENSFSDKASLDFETFVKKFGERAKQLLKKDYDSAFKKAGSFSRSSYMDPEVIKKKQDRIRENFEIRIALLENALKLDSISFAEETDRTLINIIFGSFESRMKKRYKLYKMRCENWLSLLRAEKSFLTENSKKIVKKILNHGGYLIEGNEKHISKIIPSLEILNSYFQIILDLIQKGDKCEKIMKPSQLQELYDIINNLPDPDELFKNDSKNNGERERPSVGSSGLIQRATPEDLENIRRGM
jgi:SpoVK/Ycf46/Vps4 family AAA+-type ATPase